MTAGIGVGWVICKRKQVEEIRAESKGTVVPAEPADDDKVAFGFPEEWVELKKRNPGFFRIVPALTSSAMVGTYSGTVTTSGPGCCPLGPASKSLTLAK